MNQNKIAPVYVFASSLSGIQDSESARFASHYLGAEAGISSGPNGQTYALPCQGAHGQPLSLTDLTGHVNAFLDYASQHPEQAFQIARLACGADGYDDLQVAKLFAQAPSNCSLPGLWVQLLGSRVPARVLVYDPGLHLKDREWQKSVRQYLRANLPLWDTDEAEIVTVGTAEMQTEYAAAADALRLRHHPISADSARYGRDADIAAELDAIWFSTHLLTIIDFETTADSRVVRITGAATRNGLHIDQLDSSGLG